MTVKINERQIWLYFSFSWKKGRFDNRILGMGPIQSNIGIRSDLGIISVPDTGLTVSEALPRYAELPVDNWRRLKRWRLKGITQKLLNFIILDEERLSVAETLTASWST